MDNIAHQAPLSMGFSRQEYWSGLPFPSPGDLPNPGIKPGSPALQADSLLSEPSGKPDGTIRETIKFVYTHTQAELICEVHRFKLCRFSYMWIFR